MASYFLSDLHLDASHPAATRRFSDALDRAASGDSVYLLGDLVEAWIGDDDDDLFARALVELLAWHARRGVSLNFLHGNRDFLLGERFAAEAGLRRLDPQVVVDVGGVPTLLLHGDELCIDDAAYLAFRALVRDPAWQGGFLSQRRALRGAFAARARGESAAHGARLDAAIADVSPLAVADALRRHGVRRMIHGHTHRCARHAFALDGHFAERIVLADWYERGSVLVADVDGGLRFEAA